MRAETPDGPGCGDSDDRHLGGLEGCNRGLEEGRHGNGRKLIRELAADPEAATKEERRSLKK
jgi:hypothetical protein